MINKRWLPTIIGTIAIGIIIFIIFQQWKLVNPTAKGMSLDEARSMMVEKYQGEVTGAEEKDGHYLIKFSKNDRHYEVDVNPENGEVLYFNKIAGDVTSEQLQDKNVTEKKSGEEKQSQTAETIKISLMETYPGEMVLFKQIIFEGKAVYKVIIKKEDQKVILLADTESGEIISEKVVPLKDHQIKVTEEEAISIALEQVKGIVEDVDLEDDDDEEVPYYLVEIETTKEREAVIQIDAITGEILTISWED